MKDLEEQSENGIPMTTTDIPSPYLDSEDEIDADFSEDDDFEDTDDGFDDDEPF